MKPPPPIRIALAALLFCRSVAVCAQDSTLYFFDENYSSCARENLKYIGFGVKEKRLIKFTCYVGSSGVLMIDGYYSDSTLAVKQGFFTYYDTLGYKESEGSYVNNDEDGLWLYWAPGNLSFGDTSYHLSDSSFFQKGNRITQVSFSFHKNGAMASRNFHDYSNKINDITIWNDDGTLASKALFKNGTGDDVAYFPGGGIKSVRHSQKGKLVSTKLYHEDGSEVTKKESDEKSKELQKDMEEFRKKMEETEPRFPGGREGFINYLDHHIQWPEAFARQIQRGESIKISFILNEFGFAYDIKVLEFQNYDLQEAVVNAFKNMPAWDMKGRKSYGPVIYTINLSKL